jgi:hypothetical protein
VEFPGKAEWEFPGPNGITHPNYAVFARIRFCSQRYFSPKTISEVGKPGDGPSTIKANDAVLACIAADKKAKRDEVSGLGRAPLRTPG